LTKISNSLNSIEIDKKLVPSGEMPIAMLNFDPRQARPAKAPCADDFDRGRKADGFQ
jgi:hypothetical protein